MVENIGAHDHRSDDNSKDMQNFEDIAEIPRCSSDYLSEDGLGDPDLAWDNFGESTIMANSRLDFNWEISRILKEQVGFILSIYSILLR